MQKSNIRCWECGKELMLHKGQPVFKEYTDPAGHTHKLHKICFENGEYGKKGITAAPPKEE